MNSTKLLFIAMILFAFFSNSAFSAEINKNNLYGSWQCKYDFNDPNKGLKLNFNYNIHFMENGTSQGFATLLVSMGGLPELIYKEIDESLWTVKDNELNITTKNIQFINVNNPDVEKLLDLQQLFPKKVNESVKIIELTKNLIKIKPNKDSGVYQCSKI